MHDYQSYVYLCRRGDDEEDDDDRGWSEKKGESHLEVKAYGFKTIYYVVSSVSPFFNYYLIMLFLVVRVF